ncbi:hypothetical protein D3C76_1740370 [compost metagenome]
MVRLKPWVCKNLSRLASEVPSGEWNTWGISISCCSVIRSSGSTMLARTSPASGSVSQVSLPR